MRGVSISVSVGDSTKLNSLSLSFLFPGVTEYLKYVKVSDVSRENHFVIKQ